MQERNITTIGSTAAIAGHPLHPIFIVFPVGFLVALPFVDALYIATRNACWAQTAMWLAAAGFIMGITSAVFGLIDFVSIGRARTGTIGWAHALGNVTAMLITLGNWVMRVPDPAGVIQNRGLTVSILVAILLGITGWLGGELVYRRGIGVVGNNNV